MRFLTTGLVCLTLASPLALTAGARADSLAGSYLSARQAMIQSDYEDAARSYTRAIMFDRANASLLESAVLAYIGLGDVDVAVPLSRRLEALEPENRIARLVLLVDMLRSELTEMDLATLEPQMDTGDLTDMLLLGWAWMDAGDVMRALEVFEGMANASEYAEFGLMHKALALAYVGDFEGTVQLLTDPDTGGRLRSRRSVELLARSLGQLDRAEEGADLLADALDVTDPQFRALHDQLAAGQPVPFDMIRTPQDGMAEALMNVGLLLNGQAADGFTLLYMRLSNHLSPTMVDPILLSAQLLENLEQYDLATEAYNLVPRDNPAFLRAEIGRAEALGEAGKPDAAIEVLQQLAKLYPDVPRVHATLGDTFRRESRFAEAVTAYDRALALYEDGVDEAWFVYYARGICHERTDNWPAAEADFRRALELNPGQPSVLNYLGYSLVEKRLNLDEALAMIRQASDARPDSGYITDSLGWVLYRLGRFDEAVAPMEKAVSLMPIDPVVNDHLGDVYWAVGRFREAEFQWRRALSFISDEDGDDHDANPPRIRRKLEIGLDAVLVEEGAPSHAEKAAAAAQRATEKDG